MVSAIFCAEWGSDISRQSLHQTYPSAETEPPAGSCTVTDPASHETLRLAFPSRPAQGINNKRCREDVLVVDES